MDGLILGISMTGLPIFRIVLLVAAIAIFWIVFVKTPVEYMRKRRNLPDNEAERLTRQSWGDASLAAASARSVPSFF
jgi:hypothetical protein